MCGRFDPSLEEVSLAREDLRDRVRKLARDSLEDDTKECVMEDECEWLGVFGGWLLDWTRCSGGGTNLRDSVRTRMRCGVGVTGGRLDCDCARTSSDVDA